MFDFFADFVLQLFVLDEELDLSLDGAVPVVLDGVVSAAAEELGDDGPSVTKTGFKGRLHSMGLHDGDVFLFRPALLLDARVQVVMPPESSPPYRSLHCLPIRPGRFCAMKVQFFGPCLSTNFKTISSSSLVHGPLIRVGLSTFCQR